MFGRKACTLTRDEVEQRVTDLMGRLSLKEKVWLLNGNWDVVRNQRKYGNSYNPVPIRTNGNKRLGISPIAFVDGPRGVVAGTSTCFPVSMARGASFDRDLERRIGNAIGREARAQGANYFGGVCINLLRHPAWGRAQETYGEDPYLVGELGAELTRGVQHHNVMACAKHYAVNNIENTRFKVNVKADERTMREVYLPHFKKCIDAGAASVMGAYNKFRGDQACESAHLLTKVLRDGWGFEGFTISDFIFGVRRTKMAIEAGLDVEMPLPIHYQKELLRAVQEGKVDEATVDLAVRRVLHTLTVFEHTPDPQSYGPKDICAPEHVSLAREAAEQSMVLIKNRNSVLPFAKPQKKVLVAGSLATKPNTGDHGSSDVTAPYVVTPLEGLKTYLGDGVEIVHCDENDLERGRRLAAEADCVIIVAGNDFNDEGEYIVMGDIVKGEHPIVVGTRNMGMPLKARILKASMAKMFGSWETPDGPVGGDRASLSLKDAEIRMIRELGSVNPNTVVSLVGGSMIMTAEWDEQVPAILYGWYSGMEGGHALARVLFGEVSPSGKLPFTIPQRVDDLPYFSSRDHEIEYDLFHGYTLLHRRHVAPAYPFGFGLSYTSFSVGAVKATAGDAGIAVEALVTNTGSRGGAEVVQVYVGKPDSAVERPVRLLRGFTKVRLEQGASANVRIEVPRDELRYYSNEQDAWVLEPGQYRVYVGTSSAEDDLTSAEVRIDA